MRAREQIYDYSIAEELSDGTVRYWMEDQWRDACGDADFGLVKHSPRYRRQLAKHLLATGRVLWLVIKAIALLSWYFLRIAWKVLWIVIVVFCFQSLMGSLIVMSHK